MRNRHGCAEHTHPIKSMDNIHASKSYCSEHTHSKVKHKTKTKNEKETQARAQKRKKEFFVPNDRNTGQLQYALKSETTKQNSSDRINQSNRLRFDA